MTTLVAPLSYTAIVGRVIRMRRELKGISLQEMASALGKSSSGWSRAETGVTEINIVMLRKAARVLDMSPALLLRAADELAAELLQTDL